MLTESQNVSIVHFCNYVNGIAWFAKFFFHHFTRISFHALEDYIKSK